MIYAEITRGGAAPQFILVEEGVAVGRPHKLAVLEMAGRPGWWRVWVDGQAVTDPVRMRGSSGRWAPIATAESWNAGTPACNAFGFRFERVSVSYGGGGSWRPFVPGSPLPRRSERAARPRLGPCAVGRLRTHPRERGRRAVRVRRCVPRSSSLGVLRTLHRGAKSRRDGQPGTGRLGTLHLDRASRSCRAASHHRRPRMSQARIRARRRARRRRPAAERRA